MPASMISSSISMRSSMPSEFASLVVPKGARPVQPSSSSHSQCSTKRSRSGAPSSPKGVSTGAITPEKMGFVFMSAFLVVALRRMVLAGNLRPPEFVCQAGMGMPSCGTGTL